MRIPIGILIWILIWILIGIPTGILIEYAYGLELPHKKGTVYLINVRKLYAICTFFTKKTPNRSGLRAGKNAGENNPPARTPL
jgi:hypothetical protein